jgi:hypothetical protein
MDLSSTIGVSARINLFVNLNGGVPCACGISDWEGISRNVVAFLRRLPVL